MIVKLFNKAIATLSTNYWATPAAFVGAAFILFSITISIDLNFKMETILPFLELSSADSIKMLLSVISTTIMTVTGVIFSMTLLAVVHASSQIGPRILSGFLDDRGNQVTLGILVGCFVYSLLTLSVIHSVESGTAFLPKLSLVFVSIWTITAIFSFIYFIHHVPAMIRTTYAVSRVGKKSVEEVNSYFTKSYFKPDINAKSRLEASMLKYTTNLHSDENGYLRFINFSELIDVLKSEDLLLSINYDVGDFVVTQDVVAKLYSQKPVDTDVIDKIMQAIVVGSEKSMSQDYRFGVYLLMEIGARALSPGINDPFTYKECLDQLKATLVTFKDVSHPANLLYDDANTPRIIMKPFDLSVLINDVLVTMKHYVKDDPQGRPYFDKFFKDIVPISRPIELKPPEAKL